MRILIIEDDAVSRSVLQNILSEYGEVFTVPQGVDALKIFLLEKFDLICLDLNLPQLNGHDVLTYIRAYETASRVNPWEATKVLITSVLKDKENVFRAFEGTADGYLTKPLDLAKLNSYLKEFKLID